jgi:hypothetical protein
MYSSRQSTMALLSCQTYSVQCRHSQTVPWLSAGFLPPGSHNSSSHTHHAYGACNPSQSEPIHTHTRTHTHTHTHTQPPTTHAQPGDLTSKQLACICPAHSFPQRTALSQRTALFSAHSASLSAALFPVHSASLSAQRFSRRTALFLLIATSLISTDLLYGLQILPM